MNCNIFWYLWFLSALKVIEFKNEVYKKLFLILGLNGSFQIIVSAIIEPKEILLQCSHRDLLHVLSSQTA